LAAGEDGTRGFDHGVFVPFLIVDPAANIPVVTMSIERNLDPARHIAVGKALAALRDQGVVVVGSGMSFHDLRHFFDGDGRASAAFDAWLDETLTKSDPATRERRLIAWKEAPYARACHPREEHLIPLMVVAGAAGEGAGRRSFKDVIGGKTISGFRFD
jgi:aromatic ring-opening dioxygenase catalytic subunit (LigB family)